MIKTWRQRCEEHPDHDGIVSEAMIQARMQEEIDELRAAFESAQDPVAWMTFNTVGEEDDIWYENPDGKLLEGWTYKPLYTATRQWQGLTGDEVNEFAAGCHLGNLVQGAIRKAEAKLKEKNT